MSEVILLLRGGCTRRLNYKIYFVTAKARMQVVLIAVIAVCSQIFFSLKRLTNKPKGSKQSRIDPFATFVCQTANNCNNSHWIYAIKQIGTNISHNFRRQLITGNIVLDCYVTVALIIFLRA